MNFSKNDILEYYKSLLSSASSVTCCFYRIPASSVTYCQTDALHQSICIVGIVNLLDEVLLCSFTVIY